MSPRQFLSKERDLQFSYSDVFFVFYIYILF